jgi:hypothetical protein
MGRIRVTLKVNATFPSERSASFAIFALFALKDLALEFFQNDRTGRRVAHWLQELNR